jgi:ribose transport system ATP-binding protein
MDEPTASLAVGERDIVFAAIRRLQAQQTSFIYVSHFLDEILELTDEVTVLRDGVAVDHRPASEFDAESLIHAIVGRAVTLRPGHGRAPVERRERRDLVRVERLSTPSGLSDVGLRVAAGEIVGLAGLLGSGRTELLRAIFGADRRTGGTVEIDGRALADSIPAAIAAGVALVPEDRNEQGLLLDKTIRENVALPFGRDLRSSPLTASTDLERERAERAIADLSIVAPGPEAIVRSLSGGNAQKVLFGRWLLSGARVLLLDEPMAGIDIGAKAQLAERIRAHADAGGAAIIADSEFEELLALTDRVYVLRSGRIIAERRSDDTTDHDLLALASGLVQGAA